jgi:hypothetical protein
MARTARAKRANISHLSCLALRHQTGAMRTHTTKDKARGDRGLRKLHV